MKSRPLVLLMGLAALLCGLAACTSTPETAASSGPGSGAVSEGSTYGTDAGSASVGGAGMGGADNGSGSGTSVIGSH